MNEVIQAAAQLQAICESHRWQYCFIGGLAVQRCQTGLLDWNYIRCQLQPLAELKEAPEIMGELERRRAECER